nr:putative RNA-dependent RNA polymerase [Rhizoctonia solani mitovirus 95]
MILTMIFSLSALSLIHYMDKTEQLSTFMVNQPLKYYLFGIVLLVGIKAIQLIINIIPHMKGLYRSLSRITSRMDNLANKLDNPGTSSNPFKDGQKRSLSTKSTHTTTPLKKGNLVKGNTLSRLLSSRRIKGLFASILENGSTVSLEPTHVLERPKGLTEETAAKIVADYQSEGIIAKAVTTSKGLAIKVQKHGSVSDLIIGLGWRVIAAVFPNKVNFTSRMRLLKMFSNYIFRMYKVNGATQVVKYLKASQLALQKAIGKDKIDNMRVLDGTLLRSKLTSSGLPVIIPSRDRRLIIGGSPSIIRFWLTLFSIYRVISIPGTLKLETIISPLFPGPDMPKVVKAFYSFLNESAFSSMLDKRVLRKEAELLFLEAASATSKVAWLGLFRDPRLLAHLKLAHYARAILLTCGQDRLLQWFDTLQVWQDMKLSYSPHLSQTEIQKATPGSLEQIKASPFSDSIIADPEGYYAGKLSIKEEAAGKMRVFAMVDVWSQTVLKPIEQMLAKFLKGLPNDGVYNQHASELRARDKALNAGCAFGYDLSAATDRLPLFLQSHILNLVAPDLGDHWALFLTKRDYYLYLPDSLSKEIGAHPKTMRVKVPNSLDIRGLEVPIYYNSEGRPWVLLRYAVGQPMGALSSFAMLSVTHHMIVQFAYRVAYSVPMSLTFNKDTWYTNYECTGDDIIIFDAKVASEYLKLMSSFGVPINTTKSVVSKVAVTEYLKVTSLNGRNVGALSWRMFMSGNSLMGRANIIFALLSKGVIRENIISYIEKVARLSPYSKNSNLTPTLIALWSMLANQNVVSVEECMKALINGKERIFKLGKAILMNADTNKIVSALPGIFLNRGLTLKTSKATEYIWKYEHPWFKITLWKPLAVFVARTKMEEDVESLCGLVWELLEDSIGSPELPEQFELYKSSQMLLDNEGEPLAPFVADHILLYHMLQYYIGQKIQKLGSPIFESGIQIDSPLPLLVEQNDNLKRYQEFMDLTNRADLKLTPGADKAPARIVRPTELRIIQLLRKMGNRPMFTVAPFR